ncbi:MAG: FAD-dependent 5-carboxymethylaminomethyl-2-thiouridine(34) oxidoreductase MnmC [Leptospirales bacterium]|nr:FAD-dependent 5-carboxymethylaminomethyl-2-thiouridine(34) oxidoreductase MnmC [Leptospirales bacterium]
MSQQAPIARIQTASLEWRGDCPISEEYGDIYFQPEDAIAESEHVFLNACDLNGILAQAPQVLHIGELGFGVGLNFLLSAERFIQRSAAPQRLIYQSCELRPLTLDDLRRALRPLTRRPALLALAEELLELYPEAEPGLHVLPLLDGRIRLLLYLGDAADWLREMAPPECWNGAAVDLWYLDGFAPARNPAMWKAELFAQMASRSRAEAALSTFSAAAQVRRDLSASGFVVEKQTGFGRKREMLSGRYRPAPGAALWSRRAASPGRALILGGGLAGCALAAELAERRIVCTILDQHLLPAGGASGAAAGIAMPHLSALPTAESLLSLAALRYLRRRQRYALQSAAADANAGAALLCWNEVLEQRWRRALLAHGLTEASGRMIDEKELRELSGFGAPCNAVYLPQSLLLSAAKLCQLQIQQGDIEFRGGQPVDRLQGAAGDWNLLDREGAVLASGPQVFFACSDGALQFELLARLPLHRLRGQALLADASTRSQNLRLPICYDGYVTPAVAGQHTIGATFERWNDLPTPQAESSDYLWRKAQQRFPEFAATLSVADPVQLPARVGFRCVSRDHRPLVGALGASGLYASLAFGSRGIAGAQLAAAALAALVCGEAPPLEWSILRRMDPLRFNVGKQSSNF